jgi:hypothetical protein
MIVSSLCPTSLLVNLDTAYERVVRHAVNVITNCPLAFAVAVNCLDVGDVLSARRRKAGRFQRHRIEYEKVASSHEQRKNPKLRCLITIFLPALLPVDVPAGIILFELFSNCQGIILMIVTNLLLLSIWLLKLVTLSQ